MHHRTDESQSFADFLFVLSFGLFEFLFEFVGKRFEINFLHKLKHRLGADARFKECAVLHRVPRVCRLVKHGVALNRRDFTLCRKIDFLEFVF